MTSLLELCGGSGLRIDAEKSILRPLLDADLSDEYLGWLNDPEINLYSVRRHRSFTYDDMAAYVADANGSPDRLLLGLFSREDDQHLGNVLVELVDHDNGLAEIANLLGEKSKWGSGVMVDADKHVFHFGFRQMGVRKFLMGNLSPNRAATFKSTCLGAQIEGRFRRQIKFGDDYVDLVRLGLFPDELYARFPELEDKVCWRIEDAPAGVLDRQSS